MPGSAGTGSGSVAVIIERLDGVRADLSELKGSMQCISDRQGQFERNYGVEHIKVVESTSQAHRRLDELKTKIDVTDGKMDTLQKTIGPLVMAYRVLIWVGTVLGGSVLVLVWMLITGEVRLVWP